MNTLNEFLMTVNDKEIIKEENNHRVGRFMIDIVDNKNRPHRQWYTNMYVAIDTCNKWDWTIQQVVMFIPEKKIEYRYQPGVNIR